METSIRMKVFSFSPMNRKKENIENNRKLKISKPKIPSFVTSFILCVKNIDFSYSQTVRFRIAQLNHHENE